MSETPAAQPKAAWPIRLSHEWDHAAIPRQSCTARTPWDALLSNGLQGYHGGSEPTSCGTTNCRDHSLHSTRSRPGQTLAQHCAAGTRKPRGSYGTYGSRGWRPTWFPWGRHRHACGTFSLGRWSEVSTQERGLQPEGWVMPPPPTVTHTNAHKRKPSTQQVPDSSTPRPSAVPTEAQCARLQVPEGPRPAVPDGHLHSWPRLKNTFRPS